jgi:phage baseplate assembly protein W
MAIAVQQNQKVYSFDSVGELASTDPNLEISVEDSPPIGIKTPIQLESAQADFVVMHRELDKQIKDNFKNLLLTNHGERIMLSDFGANLRPLTFELQSEGGVTAALKRIKEATEKFMPFISLQTFEPFELENTQSSVAKIGARITYSVPSANISDQSIEIILYSVS